MAGETEVNDIDSERVDQDYHSGLGQFTDALEQAIVSSHAVTAIDAGQRRFWASVLFTRLCTVSVSILWLCPRSKVNPDGTHWDFSSIPSLTRNLFECSLLFHYLAIEEIPEDEWLARLKVMQLHDCMERFRMFTAFGHDEQQLEGFELQAVELRGALESNQYFANLPVALRKKLLKGERPSILTQDAILERMGQFHPSTRGYYRLLSSHSHSFPLAFYRMAEQDRGRGEENVAEKGYIAYALEFCAGVLEASIGGLQKTFADIVAFAPGTFDWNSLKAVSPVQDGRAVENRGYTGHKWDTNCSPRGCQMFIDVLRGDSGNPADPKDYREYITIVVAVDRRTLRPAYFSFHMPPNADRDQGVFVSFTRTVREGDHWKLDPDADKSRRIPFVSCNMDSCIARIPGGLLEEGEEGYRIDLLDKFLNSNHVMFLYMKGGKPYRTMLSLSTFQQEYKRMLTSELGVPEDEKMQ